MKIFCHQCGKKTNHKIISKQAIDTNHPDDTPSGENHIFARCAGCDAFTYAVEIWSADDWDPNTGDTNSDWRTYPRGEAERKPIEGLYDLPSKVRRIYQEVLGAMNAQLPVLAGVGLRALIESICTEQGIKGNLAHLIDGLATKGVLSKAQSDILHTHRFLGNVAAHEITSAQPHELIAALEIAENVLKTIYILPDLAKQVKTGRKP